jgi:hypothetical protein
VGDWAIVGKLGSVAAEKHDEIAALHYFVPSVLLKG